MSSVKRIPLNNGTSIPIIGTGAWAPDEAEAQSQVKGWILTALKNGFRHIDTAKGYLTEAAVGQAIRESGIPRKDIFVTTKLPFTDHHRVAESFNESFKDLDVEYIDLYLMHFPQALEYEPGTRNLAQNPDGSYKKVDTVTFNESWAEIEKLLDTGKVKAIGVSNFSPKNLDKLLSTAKVTPAVNQVELHPYLAQEDLRAYCAEKGIVLTAYTPSGYAEVRGDPLIVELAKKYKSTPNQVILAWHIARDIVIVPKSVNSDRQKENITVSQVLIYLHGMNIEILLQLPTLESEDVKKISGLDRGKRICNGPDKFGQVYGWTMEELGW
ncbi:reductase AKOR2 [Crucibulum laeve]|uniref:Reductase AKOR2 n=1 Tax=Crucibulum laeve TaxID=68775 RepID=A0A5C3LX94_9AGAR|nr:reductase AKOR2 [Crucibulum laeve]